MNKAGASAPISLKTKTINKMKSKIAEQTQRIRKHTWLPILIGLTLAGASVPILAGPGNDNRAPEVPVDITVGENQKVHFHGFGVGVQIYTWDGSGWGVAVPDATLYDADGNIVAT